MRCRFERLFGSITFVVEDMAPSTFPSWLRRLRKAHDLTQRELAQRVGCTEDLIAKMEAGRRKPSKQMAGLLAEQLHVPAAERAAFIALARAAAERPADQIDDGSASVPIKALPPHALPPEHTRLFGRAHDVARIAALLHNEDTRLLTLTGAGGVGKTRLALAVARAMLPAFEGGVWFVALESLASPALVTEAIAATMGAPLTPDAPATPQLATHIAGQHMLIVLDNFEHILPAAADVFALLSACPKLVFLTTSRERLRLRAERVVLVKPLMVPERDAAIDTIASAPAVQMLVDRASAINADFALNEANAAAVADLCWQLDGMPLAIELVAAWAGFHSIAVLAAGLQSQVLGIDSDLRDMPVRQRSLWHTADWSYSLLTADEQRCFRRLAALPAGANLPAATAVSGVPQAEHVLRALVEKNLITTSDHAGESRFGMLMPLREYGLARLAEAGEVQATRAATTSFFVTQAESLYADYFRNVPNIDERWRTLDLDMDNLRAVMQWADEAGDASMFVRLSCSLRRFMRVRDHMSEGLAWSRRAVALIDHVDKDLPNYKRLRADAHGAFGTYLCEMGDTALGVQHLRNAADEAREQGYAMRLISCLINLGYGHATLGEYDAARLACEECLHVCEAAGDHDSLIDVRMCLGTIALRAADWPEARRQLEIVLERFREMDNTSAMIIALNNLAVACQNMDDIATALQVSKEALQCARDAGMQFLIGDITGNLAYLYIQAGDVPLAQRYLIQSLKACWQTQSLESLANGFMHAAEIALLRAAPEKAALFLGTARRITTERNAPLTLISQQSFDEMLQTLRSTLEEQKLTAAMTVEQQDALSDIVDRACAWLA